MKREEEIRKSEVGSRKTEVGSRKSEAGSRKPEVKKEQRAESKGQRAKGKEQRAESKGLRAKGKEQRAESKGQRAKRGAGLNRVSRFPNRDNKSANRNSHHPTSKNSTVFQIIKPSATGTSCLAEGRISGSQAIRACLMIRFFNN